MSDATPKYRFRYTRFGNKPILQVLRKDGEIWDRAAMEYVDLGTLSWKDATPAEAERLLLTNLAKEDET